MKNNFITKHIITMQICRTIYHGNRYVGDNCTNGARIVCSVFSAFANSHQYFVIWQTAACTMFLQILVRKYHLIFLDQVDRS